METHGGGASDPIALLRAHHVESLGAGDYCALLASLPMTPSHEEAL